MNYGWAVLVIVFVLGTLMVIFNMMGMPESCIFEAAGQGFTCSGVPMIYVSANNQPIHIAVKIENNFQDTVEINGVACSLSKKATKYVSVNYLLTPGESKVIKDIPCFTEEGKPIYGSEGQNFRGYLFVKYTFQNDVVSGISRNARATVSGKVNVGVPSGYGGGNSGSGGSSGGSGGSSGGSGSNTNPNPPQTGEEMD